MNSKINENTSTVNKFDYHIENMINYDIWEKEWDKPAIIKRSESIKACQKWLDKNYPGAKILSRSYSQPCFLRFASQDQKIHFVLTWC